MTDTTDLVARLRKAAKRGKPDGHMMLATNELRDAADEIERLERENQDLHGQLDAHVYKELKREQS